MKRALVILACVAGGCADAGTPLEIQDSPAVDPSTCTVTPTTANFNAIGFFDPAGDPNVTPKVPAGSFTLNLRLINTTQAPSGDLTITAGTAVHTQENNISLRGFDMCWVRADQGSIAKIDSFDEGSPIDCSSLPATRRGFFPASGLVVTGSVKMVTQTDILDLAALQSLLGADYDPVDPKGAFDSPDPTGVPILLQLRAVGAYATGATVKSAWYVYPINICTHCVRNFLCPAPKILCHACDPFDGVQLTSTSCAATCT